MTYQSLQAKAKAMSQKGMKLRLWEDGGKWRWQWAFINNDGNAIVLLEGWTDAATKPVALAFALNSI